MPRLTKKIIEKACADSIGIPADYCELVRIEGYYYWAGKAGTAFAEGWTGYNSLNALPLDRWVSQFKGKVAEWEKYRYKEETFNEYLSNIKWIGE